jgi:hypothetical protein
MIAIACGRSESIPAEMGSPGPMYIGVGTLLVIIIIILLIAFVF